MTEAVRGAPVINDISLTISPPVSTATSRAASFDADGNPRRPFQEKKHGRARLALFDEGGAGGEMAQLTTRSQRIELRAGKNILENGNMAKRLARIFFRVRLAMVRLNQLHLAGGAWHLMAQQGAMQRHRHERTNAAGLALIQLGIETHMKAHRDRGDALEQDVRIPRGG